MARALRPTRPNAATVRGLARELGALLAELDLAEIEVAWGGVRVRVQRAGATPAAPAAPAAAPAPAPAPLPVSPAGVDVATGVPIESPMVGTFYRAPSPGADPYVREGDVVKEGQILCIIEAMKLMNEIESRVAGRVAKVLVENGHGVEYGQPLFLIEPVR
ncbi:MAG: acetyl-CoA carboxylase biotin carboxyl carrier protein [Candidatus Rokubacteria bacterium]|nr:acetyl-CoA carboxylase biotin carboxyl carrier protein [Candidatus Rokubacteria bacterium]